MTHLPVTIDCQYLRSQFAAAFLIQEGNEALFIENNTAHSVPILLKELENQGLHPNQVKYLVVTHVHLDHAGGSSALLKVCPKASLLAHPKAVQHLVDPSRLVASAKKVYGEETFKKLYGEMEAISPDRVRALEDEEEIKFGSRTLRFFYTRGHANHHLCIYDSGSRGVFTGDSFGLAYPALQKEGMFIFPSTSPTDFDPEAAQVTLRRILDTKAERAYLTHFGEIKNLDAAAEQLSQHLAFSRKLLERGIESQLSLQELTQLFEKELKNYYQNFFKERGSDLDSKDWEILTQDLELNASGIAWVATKKRNPGS